MLSYTTSSDIPYVLGQPFFRQFTVRLDYNEYTVGIIDTASPASPITPITLPVTTANSTYGTSTMTVGSDNVAYNGGIGLGTLTGLTQNAKVEFDTYQNYTMVTDTLCTTCGSNWFDVGNSNLIVGSASTTSLLDNETATGYFF